MQPEPAEPRKARIRLGCMSEEFLTGFIKTHCTRNEAARLPEIISKWKSAREKFLSLKESEKGEAEKISFRDISAENSGLLKEIENDTVFRKNFRLYPYEFRMVELGRLVTMQNKVDLWFADKISGSFSAELDEKQLMDICLLKKPERPEISEFNVEGQRYYVSDDPGFMFLGDISKTISKEDAEYSLGGSPVKGILTLLGYGSFRMNGLLLGRKVILHNGVHRAFALYSHGVRFAPMILQKVPGSSFEQVAAHLRPPKDGCMTCPRPPMLKDFFDPGLTVDIEAKPVKKAIKISVSHEDMFIPAE